MKKNKKCILCGKEYEYCSKCTGKNQPRWRSLYDVENCRNIFNACSNYYAGVDINEVKKELADCDLKDKKNYNDSIKNAINAITKPITKIVKKEEEISE